MSKKIKVLAISGSLRKKSTNKGMLRYAQENAPADMQIMIADIANIPFYNQDITQKPASVEKLFTQMKEADAFIFAATEYNYSMAPALKNALDWASREPDNYLLSGKPAAVMGSGGGMGSSRAQAHLRQVAVFLNLHMLPQPEVFANAFSDDFDEEGNLVSAKIQTRVVEQLEALKKLVLQF
ncbi:MAG TPA: NAD(P)H-dependent oxidoreductase [Candidatus Moranbacteria bacterium]|nr:NAD(P)H-dependent oxidoreductase [Candidatus Moranbacteria bacterium]